MLEFKSLSTNYTQPLSPNSAKDMLKEASKLETGQINRSFKLRGYDYSGLGSRFSSSSKATAGFFSLCKIAYTSSVIGVAIFKRRAHSQALRAVGMPSATVFVESMITGNGSPRPSRCPTV